MAAIPLQLRRITSIFNVMTSFECFSAENFSEGMMPFVCVDVVVRPSFGFSIFCCIFLEKAQFRDLEHFVATEIPISIFFCLL